MKYRKVKWNRLEHLWLWLGGAWASAWGEGHTWWHGWIAIPLKKQRGVWALKKSMGHGTLVSCIIMAFRPFCPSWSGHFYDAYIRKYQIIMVKNHGIWPSPRLYQRHDYTGNQSTVLIRSPSNYSYMCDACTLDYKHMRYSYLRREDSCLFLRW